MTVVSLSWAQVAPAPAPEPTTQAGETKAAPVPVTKVAADPSAASGDAIQLSPFEVTTANNKGYFAANSMSGTRFNTKVEDLASSLSVVTKEQMQDFAMLDINDVFLYTASTEGTGTYTDLVVDRNGQVTDNVQMNPTGANRVRGIASANSSYGNYETMNRVPVDPLAMDGIELSRGPNANVFGLGNPSGTVNQVPVTANVLRDRSRVEFRADSYDGYRTSLDVNRVLKSGVLAVRASGAFQHDGFIRKPSGVNSVRYNAMIKYQPFKNTTITAAFLHYKMNGNRPNYTPPRDYVSDWLAAGKPGWDPILQVIHINGQTYGNGGLGTTTPITSDANIPAYFSRAGTIQTRNNIFIDQTGLAYWTTPSSNNPNPTSGGVTPAANTQSVRLFQTGLNLGTNGASLGRYTNQPLFTTTPTVSSKSIYDWTKINLSSVNRLMDQTDTYNVQLEQVFLNTPRQLLAAQAGFFRENSDRYQRTPIGNSGTSGQSGQLFVDPNERLLDGSTNPFFGRPYIGVTEPLTIWQPWTWDTSRAQVAYRLDLTHEKNFLKWLGINTITGYDEYKYRIQRQFAYRDVLSSDHSWTAPGMTGFNANQPRANQSGSGSVLVAGPNITRGYFRYYLGDAVGSNVDYAPSDFTYGKYPFVWGGYTLSGGVPVAGSGVFTRDPASISQLATTDSTGGNANLKQIIKTQGAVLQDNLLDGKVITTFGLREDKVYNKAGYSPANLVNNNTQHDFANDDHWVAGDYNFNSGKTKTAGIVARPFRDLTFLNRTADGTGFAAFLADALRGLSFTYNKSDNFIPQASAVDLFLNPLPNTTGTGKDYGFWLNMFHDKLVVRVNRYNNKQLNARNSDANTVAQRVMRLDFDVSSDAYQLMDRSTAWYTLLNPTWTTDQVRAAVATQMQIPTALYNSMLSNYNAGTLAATNDVTATGTEVEINFNPTRYWTVVAVGTEGKSISSNISNAIQQWIDQRMPVWTSIVDPNTNTALGTGQSQGWVADANNPNHLWWLHNYGGSQTAQQNFGTFVNAPYSVIKQLEGKSKPSVRRYNFRLSSSLQLAALTDQSILKNLRVGGAIRWEDKGAIGYYGVNYQQLLATNQPITQLDADNPIYDKAHLYFDAFVSYRTRLFSNKVSANFQLNVRNLTEGGRLQAIGAFPDGRANAYRIVDPRQFILSASFDL